MTLTGSTISAATLMKPSKVRALASTAAASQCAEEDALPPKGLALEFSICLKLESKGFSFLDLCTSKTSCLNWLDLSV